MDYKGAKTPSMLQIGGQLKFQKVKNTIKGWLKKKLPRWIQYANANTQKESMGKDFIIRQDRIEDKKH